MIGNLTEARKQFEEGIELYDPDQHRFPNWPGGHPGEQCYVFTAFAYWMLGYPEKAIRRANDGLKLVQGLSHPFSLASVLGFSSLVYATRREPEASLQRAEAAIEICEEQQIAFYLGIGRTARGWALAAHGDGGKAIPVIHEGTATFRATKARTFLPYLLALQAEVEVQFGQLEAGRNSVEEALTLVADTEQRCWEAELCRIKAELLLAAKPDDPTAAERWLHRASTLLGARKRDHGNSALPRAWPAFGKPRGGQMRRDPFLLQSATGSPRASTLQI